MKDIEIEFGDIKAELGISGFIGNDILSQFIVRFTPLHSQDSGTDF